MATATLGHGLSVLTNSCVKQPVNPETGLTSSTNERSNIARSWVLEGRGINFGHDFERDRGAVTLPARRAEMSNWAGAEVEGGRISDDFADDLGSLSNDEFYRRLLQLKNENKKTLLMCEQLYRQKRSAEQEEGNGGQGEYVNGHVLEAEVELDSSQQYNTDTIPHDNVLDMSSKPPISRPLSSSVNCTMPLASRPSSVPIATRREISRSLDEAAWRANGIWYDAHETEELSPYHYDGTQSETCDPRESAEAMAMIEDMWENFSLDDYAPRTRQFRRPSSAHSERSAEKKQRQKEWRHRITIPKPFNMTLREGSKEQFKSKTQMQHEEEILVKQMEEELECQKKFKATPVPAHVYLPLFNEYNEQNETKRRHIKHYRQELLKSMEKPFKFYKREEEKKKTLRSNSEPFVEAAVKKHNFKAKPVPDYIYDNSVNEKQLEEEEYRRIRIKMRAEELQRCASLPPNMEARKYLKEQKLQERKTKKNKRQFVPRINRDIPDYEELYRQFQKELQRRKQEKEATVMKPFKLRTSKMATSNDKIMKDIENDEEKLTENRWPYKNPRSTPRRSVAALLAQSLDSIPQRMTNSAEMRAMKRRDRMNELTQKELEDIEFHKRQRVKEAKLRKAVLERTSANQQEMRARPSREEKQREYRQSERARMADYRKSLEDMRERVEHRPLLFEQIRQENARKAAEKKYAQTIRNHGLDETYIQQKSSLSMGTDTDRDDDYSDIPEETSHQGYDDPDETNYKDYDQSVPEDQ